MDPDYLYLMAEFLILEKRFYQAIDTIHVSLLVENDDDFLLKNNFNKSSREVINKKFKLLSELFKIIDIPELSEEVKNLNNPNDQNIFFQKMQKLMPGISFNKLK